MRRVRWAPAAADDLDGISNYLRDHYPSMSRSTIVKLYAAACSLKKFPNRGRIGQVVETRELVMSPLPYVIVYRVEPDVVNILRVLHTSQDWT